MKNTKPLPLTDLDDSSVLLVLSHMTSELRDGMAETEKNVISTTEEGVQAISSFLAIETDIPQKNSDEILSDQALAGVRARSLLAFFLEDETTRAQAEQLLRNPTVPSQRSIELAIGGAVVIGALITWLQTRIEIEVERKDGETNFRFSAKKEAAGESLIKDTVKIVGQLLS